MTALLIAAALCGAPDDRPNVLLIVADDQAWDDYGFLGSPHARTPHIDRLAANSLTFPPRVRADEPVPAEPGLDPDRAVAARARRDRQRPGRARR